MGKTQRLRHIQPTHGDRNYFIYDDDKGNEVFAFPTPIGSPTIFSARDENGESFNEAAVRSELISRARFIERTEGLHLRTINSYTAIRVHFGNFPTIKTSDRPSLEVDLEIYGVQFYQSTFLDRKSTKKRPA